MLDKYKLTKDDVGLAIEELINIIKKVGLENEVSLFVYGSYFDEWRKGLSDLDAIIYFWNKPPLDLSLEKNIASFQSEIRRLYENFDFIRRTDHFFSDLFVLDSLHAADGRFFTYDKEKTESFQKQNDCKLVFGDPFLHHARPVYLRHEQESELATGLHRLRNYLFFEIPRPPDTVSLGLASHLLKFFRILPRRVSIMNGDNIIKGPEALKKYPYLKNIDYSSFMEMWEKTSDIDKVEDFLKEWHAPGNTIFLDCLRCFEETLLALIKNVPMLSRHN